MSADAPKGGAASTPTPQVETTAPPVPVLGDTLNPAADPEPTKGSRYRSIISRLDHQVTLQYGDEKITVPPRGLVANIKHQDIVGELPKGVSFIKNTGKK